MGAVFPPAADLLRRPPANLDLLVVGPDLNVSIRRLAIRFLPFRVGGAEQPDEHTRAGAGGEKERTATLFSGSAPALCDSTSSVWLLHLALEAGASAVTLLGLAQPMARAEEKVDVPSFISSELIDRPR